MATMSSAPGATTLTPPSSSHGNQPGWKSYAASGYQDNTMQGHDEAPNGTHRGPLSSQNGNSNYDPFARQDATEPFPATKELLAGGGGRPSYHINHKRSNTEEQPLELTDENSKWIHRDKLARIENEELRAAGIILPKPRSQSRPRRERSQDKMSSHRQATDASDSQPLPRSRKNSTMTHNSAEGTPDVDGHGWDLRLPEEIAEDPGEYWVKNETANPKGSRIPVAKVSPVPVPADYLDRDAPVPRKMSSGNLMPSEDFSLSIPKPRSRSSSSALASEEAPKVQPAKRVATDGSPRKKTTTNGPRKSATTSSRTTQNGRVKPRSTSAKDARPTTRSRDLSPTPKSAPEGDPPWMVSAYKPDPRLPPDQQLLPTVAKRLQQEQWEKEGKFGNIYDKEFRPLTDEGYLSPRLQQQKAAPSPEGDERQDEWPLRPENKSPTPSRPGTSSYSTMPKIQDKPMASPLPSPRAPSAIPHSQVIRIPEPPEDGPINEKANKRGGCGCCVVM